MANYTDATKHLIPIAVIDTHVGQVAVSHRIVRVLAVRIVGVVLELAMGHFVTVAEYLQKQNIYS